MVQAINCSAVEREIENYPDLKRELKQIWKLRRVTVVPIIIGALGTVSNDIEKWLAEIGVTCRLESFAESVLTGYCQNPSQSLRHLRSRAVT